MALVVVEAEFAALGLDVEELVTLLLVLVEVDVVVVGLVLVEVVVVELLLEVVLVEELVEVVKAAELLLLADDVLEPLLPLLVLDETFEGVYFVF